jgi:hypothetical protein
VHRSLCNSTHLVLTTSGLKLLALVCSLLWMIGLLTCAVWVGHSFTKENFKVLWPISVRDMSLNLLFTCTANSKPCSSCCHPLSNLRILLGEGTISHAPDPLPAAQGLETPSSLPHGQVLRATAKLSTTIFYIPLVTTVVKLFDCSGTWGIANWQCFSGVHLTLVVIAAIVILAFSAFAFIGACYSVCEAHPCGGWLRLSGRPTVHVHSERTQHLKGLCPCVSVRRPTPHPRSTHTHTHTCTLFAALAVVGCYFTRDPRSTSLSAKAHGRVGMIIKALELMLSVTYALEGTFGLPMRLVRVHSICRAPL